VALITSPGAVLVGVGIRADLIKLAKDFYLGTGASVRTLGGVRVYGLGV
jgi:hypothetical protein